MRFPCKDSQFTTLHSYYVRCCCKKTNMQTRVLHVLVLLGICNGFATVRKRWRAGAVFSDRTTMTCIHRYRTRSWSSPDASRSRMQHRKHYNENMVLTMIRDSLPTRPKDTPRHVLNQNITDKLGRIRRMVDTTRLHLQLNVKENIEFVLNPSKNLLTTAYSRGSYLFAALAAILFLIPDHTVTVQLASKFGGAAGYGMGAGLCHILASANENDRMSSDTYLRLNLGLLGFSAIGILFFPAEAGFFFRAPPAILLSLVLTCAQGYGLLLSFLGWRRGVDPTAIRSIEELVQELKDGTIATLRGLRVDNAKQALGYRNCLLFVVAGIFSNMMEGNFNFRYREALHRSWFDVSLNGSAVSRLFMVATMIYSLKDAGERNRLSGTTFIQLNGLIGVWAMCVCMGQCIYPLGFAFYRGAEMCTFSLYFLAKTLKYFVQKQQQRDKKLLEPSPSNNLPEQKE